MKTNTQHQPASSTAASNVVAVRPLSWCRKVVTLIAQARAGILADFQAGMRGYEHLLELAVNEAEALAWQTDHPHLVFPSLAMEKAQNVAQWQLRQRFVRDAQARLAFAA
jgi:hypothetical protein